MDAHNQELNKEIGGVIVEAVKAKKKGFKDTVSSVDAHNQGLNKEIGETVKASERAKNYAQRLQHEDAIKEDRARNSAEKLANEAKTFSINRGAALDQQGVQFSRTMPSQDRKDFHAYHTDGLLQANRAALSSTQGTQGHIDATANVNHHTEALNRLAASAQRAHGFVAKIGHAFDTLTTYGATGSAIYAVANAFKAVVASVIELEDEMKNIQAITSSSETDMAVIGASIKGIATTTAFSIKEIAGAVKTVAQAGVEMKDIPKTVQAIADVATATGSQLQTAADIITTVKEVWDGIDVSTIGDRVAQAANVSKLQVEDLKTILSLNAAAAKSANISLEQSLSLDALLRNSGVKASTIATGSTQMMRELFSPDKKFSEFLSKQYGKVGEKVTADEASKKFSDYRSSENPLVEAISELKRIGVGDHESIAALERSMDSRALNVFKPLLNSKDSLQGLEAQMRAGATASEGAATASHTVKKAFENLGDQVEVLADAMGEPMLKPLRGFIETLNKGVVKPAAEAVERSNLRDEFSDRRSKRLRAAAHEQVVNGNTLGAVAPYLQSLLDTRHNAADEGVISDVSMKSLLPQQVKASEELNKKYEQYKNYSDAPDSLTTYFKKNKESFDNFGSRVSDTFGSSPKNEADTQTIVKLLADINPKEGADRTATIQQIQKMVGGTKTPLVSDISSIANEAAGIKAAFTDMTKSYAASYSTLSDIQESGIKLTDAQSQLLSTLEDLRKTDPQAKSAIFGNGTLSLGEMSGLNSRVLDKFAPAVAQAKKDLEDKVVLDLTQQAKSAAGTDDPINKEAAFIVIRKNITDAVKEKSVGDAVKLQHDVLEKLKTAGIDTNELGGVEEIFKTAFTNATIGIAETLAEKTASLTERIKKGIADQEAIPESEWSDTDKNVVKKLKSTQAEREGKPTGNLSQTAFDDLARENGISPEFANKIWDRESRSSGDSATSSAGAQGRMQMMPATFESMQKMFGLKGDILDPQANSEAAMKYLVYLSTPKGQEIPGALNHRISTNDFRTEADVGGAYNAGEGNYRAYQKGNRALKPETQNYMNGLGLGSPFSKNFEVKKPLAGQTDKGEPTAAVAAGLRHLETNAKVKDEDGKLAFEGKFDVWLKEQDAKIGVKQLELSKLVNDAAKSMPLERDIKALQDEKFAKKAAWIPEGDGVKSREYTAEQKKKKLSGTDSTDNDLAKQNNDVAFSKRMTQYERDLNPNDFNINAPDIVALHTRRSDIAKESERLSLPENGGSIKNEATLVKLEQERIAGVGTEYKKNDDFLATGKHYDANQLTKDNNVQASDRRKIKEQYDKDVLDSEKRINKLTADKVLKSAQATLKAISVELEANDTALKTAVTLGDKAGFEKLRTEQEGILEKQAKATLAEIEARKDTTNQDELIAEAKSKATKDKNALKHAGDFKSMMGAKSQAEIGDPIEGYARKGRQEALGHTQYLPDQKAENKRDTASKQTELAGYQAELAKATPDTVNYKILEDEVNRLTSDLAKLNTVAEDLAPTLSNQLDQISTENIVAEIDNLQGSLKNLDKNITSRVVQFADKFSTDVADSAVTAAEGLLGFNTATKEATDSLINLAQKQGDLALVKTDRVQLAQNIQSIRMNEADPVRQEMLIKSAETSQKQAEDIAAFQVEEAQKAADKVAFDNSLAGKLQGGVKDLAEGVAKDVIKSEVLGMFTETLGGSATKPMFVEVVNSPAFGLDAVSKNDPTLTGGGANKGFFSGLGAKVSGLFGNSTEAVDNTPTYAYPTDAGQSVFTPAPEIAGVSTVTPLADTGSYDPVMTPIGVNAEAMASQAQGAGEIPVAVESGAAIGVETGFGNIFDSAKGIFDDFSSSMTGSWTTFIGSLSATLGVLGSTKKKKSGFEIAQMVVGGIGAIAGAVGSIGGALNNSGLLNSSTNLGTQTGGEFTALQGDSGAGNGYAGEMGQASLFSTGGIVQDGVVQHFATGGSVQNYSTGGNVESANVQNYSTGGNVESANVQNYSTGGNVESANVQNYSTGGTTNSHTQHFSKGGTPIFDPKTGTTQLYPDQTQHGYITGPGTTTSDSIPARLSNGEYVLNAKTTKAIGKSTLDAWNFANKFPIQRATGGIADPMNYAASQVQPNAPVVAPSAPTEQSIRVVMVDDHRNVGDYISSASGEKTLVEFVRRNSLSIKQILR